MKRIMVAIIAAMVACFMLCSCMAPTIPTVPVSVTTGEAAMKEARKYYRESSCVLYARCIKPMRSKEKTVRYIIATMFWSFSHWLETRIWGR